MEFCDAHNDIWEISNGKQKIIKQWFNNEIKNSGAKKVLCAYFSKNNQACAGISEMKRCFKMLQKLGDKIVPTVENCWFLTPQNIDTFIQLRPFCCTLTHNQNNNLCGGALGNGGFTMWGKEVVSILESNNIIIDTAHLNRKSFFEFVKLTKKPIFNSHCGFDSVFKHNRNLTDEQIKIIVNSGGYIGLAFYSQFFGKFLTARSLSETLQWFVENFGKNTLGLGTDFNGVEENCLPLNIKKYTDLDKLYKSLLLKGVGKTIIDNFFCNNLYRFIN